MSNKVINLKDSMSFGSDVAFTGNGGMWAKTEVIGGYDFIEGGKNSKSTLGEVIFSRHNIVTISGVTYVMQNMF